MGLTRKQKKFIRRKYKKVSIEKMSSLLKVDPKEIISYLNRKIPDWKNTVSSYPLDETSQPKSQTPKNLKAVLKSNVVFIVLLLFFTSVAFFNSLGNAFVSDDRGIFMDKNINNWVKIFTNPFHFTERFLRGIVFTLAGYNPTAFRLINLGFHFLMVVSVFLLVFLLTNSYIAFMAAALFAVHPLVVETVVWISGVQYVIYPAFITISLICYHFWHIRKQRLYLIWSLVFYSIALISSEKAIVFPFLILAYEISYGAVKKYWKGVSAFFLLTIIPALFFLWLIPVRMQVLVKTYYESPQLLNPLIQIPVALSSYLKLFFWPYKLTLYHSEFSLTIVNFVLRVLMTLFYLSLVFYFYFKNRKIFFWLVWFLISLLPYLTPLGISWIVAERYVYLGLVGLTVVIGYLLYTLIRTRRFEVIGWLTFYIILILLSGRTIFRNMDWRSEDTLWLATAKVSPSDPKTHNNLGDYYARHNNLVKSAEEFKKAIQLKPNYADAYHNLGNTYYQMGKLKLAEKMYKKALSINPDLWQSYAGLAKIYQKQGKQKAAEDMIKKARFTKAKLESGK